MRLSPSLRKAALAIHLAVSVGWVGAVAAYLALDLAAATGDDAATLRAAYLGMGLIAGSVIVPLAIATLVTGVVLALGTKWGLVRHWWVLVSLALTVFASFVLVVETGTIAVYAAVAADPSAADRRPPRAGQYPRPLGRRLDRAPRRAGPERLQADRADAVWVAQAARAAPGPIRSGAQASPGAPRRND